jgi:hypothetical protein
MPNRDVHLRVGASLGPPMLPTMRGASLDLTYGLRLRTWH